MADTEAYIDELFELYRARGDARYGEGVSQSAHALQCAVLAERDGADAEAIAAALLHDVGHLLHQEGEDAAERGLDTRHEVLGARWLGARFGLRVREAVRWHVDAKRYLCTLEPGYWSQLSEASRLSLALQGGAMEETEAATFAGRRFVERAVLLRRWDDLAKDPDMATPDLEYFRPHLSKAMYQASLHERP